jgi:hypothetical protein
MVNDTYDLLIVFKDRPQQVIKGVESYGWNGTSSTFEFIRNGNQCFVPKDNVLYFGSLKEWRSE